MSLAGGRCFASQARFFWHFVVQRHWCWRLRVSSLTPCSSHIERRQRRSARFFNSAFVVALQAANTVRKRGARNRQRHRCGKQHRHRSKQSEYIAIHEPVPRLALIKSVYHANQGWRAQKMGRSSPIGLRSRTRMRPMKREAEKDWGKLGGGVAKLSALNPNHPW